MNIVKGEKKIAPKEIVEALGSLPTSNISDALDKLGINGGCLGIHAVIPGRKLAGSAYTVHYIPAGVEGGTVGDYIDDVEPGQVVVIDNYGRTDCTVWGDLLSLTSKIRGVAGTVIDGVCRDVDSIRELDYSTYTKSKFMVTGKDRVKVDSYNLPVNIGGVEVRPGDILVGDESGVVVVPLEKAEEVLTIARQIESAEEGISKYVREGHTLREAREKYNYHNLQKKND